MSKLSNSLYQTLCRHRAYFGLAFVSLIFSLGSASAQRALSARALYQDSIRIGSLPSVALLPDPLVLDEGGRSAQVNSISQWLEKRKWIGQQYQYWVSGSVPPAPETFHVHLLKEVTDADGVKLSTVELRFGPGDRAKMTLELMVPPMGRGQKLPVFMSQWNHRGWAQVAVRRGYIGCIYAGSDGMDDTRNYGEIYPDYSFATLMKRAWGASRVIDYLYTLPFVDTSRIALTGHSRNGKQSLMAAAFDSRIKAVVSSSGGTGGECTFRYSDDRFNSESVEEITHNFPFWFSPRLHLFAGREQKLPVDQNSLMALIAPRGLMMVSAYTEGQGNPWGVQQSYLSVKKVYHFLGADSNVAILLRQGRHQHAARDIENFLDFFDYVFGRTQVAPKNVLYDNYSFQKWEAQNGDALGSRSFPHSDGLSLEKDFREPALFGAEQDSLRKDIQWLLGVSPPGVPAETVFSARLDRNRTYPDDYLSEVIGQVSFKENSGIQVMRFGPYHPLGDDLWGAMFLPEGSVTGDSVARKLPLVIYLHGYSFATGFHRRSAPVITRFLKAGYAVLAFDMMGFGTRAEEALHFYDRYPHWSEMGKMVSDTRSVIADAYNRMPFIDTSHIFLVGYSLGGTVALMTAALDPRVRGVAAACAFSSWRSDHKGTEGIRRFYDIQGLLPRLGLFSGDEARIPIDFDGILSCIAPRPLLIIAPTGDRDHQISAVRKITSTVGTVYARVHAGDQFTVSEPATFNHFTTQIQRQISDWLMQQITSGK